MKRYTIDWVSQVEDPDGEWVRYEDAYKETKEAHKMGYFTGQNSEMMANNNFTMLQPGVKFQPVECNCQDEREKRDGFVSRELLSWICPAHGYKRL